MLRGLRICIVLVIVLGSMGALCFAQNFSADVVKLKTDSPMGISKIFVSGNKLRIEMQGGEMGSRTVIWDMAQHKRYMLMPARHMYMEFGEGMPQHGLAFWRPTDINDACPGWKTLAEQMNTEKKWGSCRKVGNDTVNGRSAVKYEGTSTDGEKTQAWLDTKLHCLIKLIENDGSGMEMRNIREGSQPAGLFVIPSDYQKMDMGSMMGHPMAPPGR